MGSEVKLEAAILDNSMSPTLARWLPAFLAAKKALGAVVRNAVNDEIGNRYADLSAVIEAVEAVALENGLVPVPSVMQDEKSLGTEVRLYHVESQEFYSCTVRFPLPSVASAHTMASLLTYTRRYALATLFNIRFADDDGNAASGLCGAKALEPASEKQQKYVRELMAERGVTVMAEGLFDDRIATSAFIDKLIAMPKAVQDAESKPDAGKSAATTLEPTERQRETIERLVKEKGVELRAEALASRKTASEYIDELKSLPTVPQGEVVVTEVPVPEAAAPQCSAMYLDLIGKWDGKPLTGIDSRASYVRRKEAEGLLSAEEADELVARFATAQAA